MFLRNTDVQDRLPLSLPAYPPLDSPGPCSVSVCPLAKHVITPINHYIKQISPKLCEYTGAAAAACSLFAWYDPTVLAWKNIFIITTADVRALWDCNRLSQQQLILYLIWPQNHVYHIYWKKGEVKKSHFPELLPLTSDETQWQSLCFGFDSQCFLFPPLPHIFGKACSINQWHTCGQGSLEPLGHRGREEFPNFVLICMEIWQKKSLTAAGPFKANICIVFIYVALQQRGLSGPLGFLLCLVKDWQMQKNDVKALTL